MPSVIQQINDRYKKPAVVDVRSGDTVKVHQKIREGSKERIQIFQGLVIRTGNKGSIRREIDKYLTLTAPAARAKAAPKQ